MWPVIGESADLEMDRVKVREYYGMVLRETRTPMMSPDRQGSGMAKFVRTSVETSVRDAFFLRYTGMAGHFR